MARIAALGRDIKLSHSIFAMPFALLAAFMAAGDMPGWWQLGLVVACMFFARTYAMLANRIADREIDGENPRTRGRALPAGRARVTEAIALAVACVVGLLVCAAGFWWLDGNFWPLALSPIVIIWLGAYGFAKRWTMACHLILGAALALSPIGAVVAIHPPAVAMPSVWMLSAFVLLWVAGFDVIYALQDIEVDQRDGIHSIPAFLGERGALWVARILHIVGLLALVGAARFYEPFAMPFNWAVVAVGILLMIEHRAAAARQFTMAFFTLNGVISVALGAVGIYEVLKAAGRI